MSARSTTSGRRRCAAPRPRRAADTGGHLAVTLAMTGPNVQRAKHTCVSADYEAFATEVGDDLHSSTERFDVRGEGSQLAGVDLGPFDG